MLEITPLLILDRAFRDAGIPIDGCFIGKLSDRDTWRIDYSPAATPAQRIQGAALVKSVDLNDPNLLAEVKVDNSIGRMSDEAIRAIVQGLFEAIPAPTMTLVQLRNRILTIYRGLI